MKTDYTVVSRFRNRNEIEKLICGIRAKGKTCYNFFDNPADPNNPYGTPEEQMKALESTKDFYNDPHFQKLFKEDQDGIKNADIVILLLPAGNAAHMEAGIAHGFGKKLILIGQPEKPETLYLMFSERYKTTDDFLSSIC